MSTPTTTEPRTRGQQAISDHLRLLTAGDIDAWVGLFAPDGVLAFPFATPGMPEQVRGRDALLAQMRGFPELFDVRVAHLRFVDAADEATGIAEFRLTGHARSTGKPYEQRCVSVVHTDADGRIVHYDDYWNPLVAMEALRAD